jgi:hypothetical protein
MPDRVLSQAEKLTNALTEMTDRLEVLDKRSLRNRRAMWVCFAIACLAIVSTITSLIYAKDAHQSTAAIIANRTESRTTQCLNENNRAQAERTALVGALKAIIPPGVTLRPDQQAALDRYKAEAEELLPFRDCSPAGIKSYYTNPPDDPAVTTTTG